MISGVIGMLGYGVERPLSGIGRYTVELFDSLMSRRDIRLWLLAADMPKGNTLASRQIKYCRLHSALRLPLLVTIGQLEIAFRASRLGLDLIHDPTGVAPLAISSMSIPSVVTVHDAIPWSYPGVSTKLDTLIYRHWLPWALRKVAAIITVSQQSRADIIRYFKIAPDRIFVIPEGVSAHFRPVSARKTDLLRKELGLPDKFLVYVGSSEPRKNLTRLLSAHSRVGSMGVNVPLVIVGSSQSYDLTTAGSRGVIWLGRLPDSMLPTLLSLATAFVFPSLYEGFGLPPLEAMSCGTPVICSNSSSLPEVVGDAAVLFDPSNVDELSECMVRVLTSPDLRADMSMRGLIHSAEFTWERTAMKTALVYEQVIGKHMCSKSQPK